MASTSIVSTTSPRDFSVDYPSKPDNEEQRLKFIEDLTLYKFQSDPQLERYTIMASNYFRCPISIISLVESEKVRFLSAIGMTDVEIVERSKWFCSHLIISRAENDVLIVPNASVDNRFCTHPLVMNSGCVRFFAGAPIIVCGIKIGSLCVIDTQPHSDDSFNEESKKMLIEMAKMASKVLYEDERDEFDEGNQVVQLVLEILQKIKSPLNSFISMQRELHSINGIISRNQKRDSNRFNSEGNSWRSIVSLRGNSNNSARHAANGSNPNTPVNKEISQKQAQENITNELQQIAETMKVQISELRSKIETSVHHGMLSLRANSSSRSNKFSSGSIKGSENGDDGLKYIHTRVWIQRLKATVILPRNVEKNVIWDYENLDSVEISDNNTEFLGSVISLIVLNYLQRWVNIRISVIAKPEESSETVTTTANAKISSSMKLSFLGASAKRQSVLGNFQRLNIGEVKGAKLHIEVKGYNANTDHSATHVHQESAYLFSICDKLIDGTMRILNGGCEKSEMSRLHDCSKLWMQVTLKGLKDSGTLGSPASKGRAKTRGGGVGSGIMNITRSSFEFLSNLTTSNKYRSDAEDAPKKNQKPRKKPLSAALVESVNVDHQHYFPAVDEYDAHVQRQALSPQLSATDSSNHEFQSTGSSIAMKHSNKKSGTLAKPKKKGENNTTPQKKGSVVFTPIHFRQLFASIVADRQKISPTE